MKRSSRLPLFLAGLAGVLLIALGLRMGKGPFATPTDGVAPSDGPGGITDLTSGSGGLAQPRSPQNSIAPLNATGPATRDTAISQELASVSIQLTYQGETTPAADAKVSLWREQTGEGAAFRPARRRSQTRSNSDGSASLSAQPHEPVEVYAMAAGDGPLVRHRLGPLNPGEVRAVRLSVERPPSPLDLSVLDEATSDPVSGAAVRLVLIDQRNLGVEEFPGTAKLLQRSDADGRAALPGSARNGKWILVDAAGYSPTAIDLRMLDGIGASEIQLKRAAKITVLVADGAGEPMANVEVQCIAMLGRYRSAFTAVTNRRGEATLPRVPASIPLVPHVGLVGDTPTLFDALTLKPGEERALEFRLQ